MTRRCVRIVKGVLPAHRSGLEDELGYLEPARHPLMAWLLKHAANLVSLSIKGPDGLTAYQRVRLKPVKTRLIRSGEMCRDKMRARETLPPPCGAG